MTKVGEKITLNFPSDAITEIPLSEEITDGFNILPKLAFKGKTDYMFIYESEEEIKNLKPDFNRIGKLTARGIIVTAKGDSVDFVSRFFAPQVGIDEDPVTGSAHTTLTPYWSKQLNKQELTAIQLSSRKGYLECKYLKERVEISGEGRLYLEGEIFIGQ